MARTTFAVETDQTGYTFATVVDAPYWVTDLLEAAYVHTDELPTPSPGDSDGPFAVEYEPDEHTIVSVDA